MNSKKYKNHKRTEKRANRGKTSLQLGQKDPQGVCHDHQQILPGLGGWVKKFLGENTGPASLNYAAVKVPLDSPKNSLKTRQRLSIAMMLDFINSDGSELIAWVPSLPALIEWIQSWTVYW
jgi:hypothetical protein